VSDFSKFRAGQQALVINSLVGIVANDELWGNGLAERCREGIEAMMCIGDGYIFVFKDTEEATYFAAYLACLIEALVARKRVPVNFHFRMGLHVGEAYTFYDPGRKDWNYIGDGINGGQRVLGTIGKEADDVVFVSGQVREALLAGWTGDGDTRRILSNLHNRGRRADKHGKWWRVYEMNHTDLTGEELLTYLPQ
jgi:class 3 adenylate cyclase